VVVVGTGAVGLPAAVRVAAAGAEVGLFGPRTDEHGRVLNVDGAVIGGRYAAGNAMGSVMGVTYGGHGGTLGPGLVFGYLAGQHAASRAAEPS
jgi:succinate dehydrogenase/fumarate reductase flavoprotein subunit